MVACPPSCRCRGENDRILDNLTRFAQFLFWGIWWPFVILLDDDPGPGLVRRVLPGRGADRMELEFGLGRPVPRWMKWAGWPFVAFVLTTVFGQMTSVYEYPKPALLILGGSTVAAIAVGLVYGTQQPGVVPPSVPGLRRVQPAGAHRAGALRRRPGRLGCRSGTRQPGELRAADRYPPHAIRRRLPHVRPVRRAARRGGTGIALAGDGKSCARPDAGPKAEPQDRWPARLLVFGMLGVALGAFQWSPLPGSSSSNRPLPNG